MEALLLYLELWFVGALVVSTGLMWWFKTGIVAHFLEVIRWAGFGKKETWQLQINIAGEDQEAFYVTHDLADFTRADLDTWFDEKLPPKWAELFTCPYCLSFHFSYLSAIVILICTWTFAWQFALAGMFTWPVVGNLILKKL